MKGLDTLYRNRLTKYENDYLEAKAYRNHVTEKLNDLPVEHGYKMFSERDYYNNQLVGIQRCLDLNLERINHYRKLLGMNPVNDSHFIVVYYEEV